MHIRVHCDGFNKLNSINSAKHHITVDGLARLDVAHSWINIIQIPSTLNEQQYQSFNEACRWNFCPGKCQLKIHRQYFMGHFQSHYLWSFWKEKDQKTVRAASITCQLKSDSKSNKQGGWGKERSDVEDYELRRVP